MHEPISIRAATENDLPLILTLIHELAEYEREPDAVEATEEDLRIALFGERPYAEVVIAEYSGESCGFALFFHNFSTWVGRPGIYLEDLYVRESMRGRGIGKALLLHLVTLAGERNCGRLEWSVLDWNQPAIDFYKSLGARPMDDWSVFRLDKQALTDLVSRHRTTE